MAGMRDLVFRRRGSFTYILSIICPIPKSHGTHPINRIGFLGGRSGTHGIVALCGPASMGPRRSWVIDLPTLLKRFKLPLFF